ncbi:STAS domain-containing protein [Nocardioides stalactiti]|uniref:STAS domain-containing protein n=1 Tax=Nocardioides stalactiti TaxID=2755356 RepID=UPI001601618F|nr:STAS domain-containing protein [Nocardioides stalactiti]
MTTRPRGHPSFTVRSRSSAALTIVRLTGELDLSSCSAVINAIRDVLAVPLRRELVVLDLREVTFCDLAGLRALDAGAVALADAGIRVDAHDTPPPVVRLVTMTGVARWLLPPPTAGPPTRGATTELSEAAS